MRASVPLAGFDRSWRWEDGRARGSLLLALGLDFADQHGGRNSGDGDGAGLGAAFTVKDFAFVSCSEDAIERGLRCSDDAYAADELVWAAIGVDAVDDERDDLEGLGCVASGDG